MTDYLIGIDSDLFLTLHSNHAPFWDYFMMIVTGRFIWGAMYLAILFALWKSYGIKMALTVFMGTVLVVFLADQFTASVLRPWIGRLRPTNPDNPISEFVILVDGYRGGAYGFPSSHAANTFAVATLLTPVFRQWRFTAGIFFWAFLNCYSRIYLGVHYPGDLLVGAIIGICAGLLVYMMILIIVSRSFRFDPVVIDRGFRGPLSLKKIGDIYPSDIVIIVEVLTVGLVALSYLWR